MHASFARGLVLALASTAAIAQNLCEGNGQGDAYLRHSPAIIGKTSNFVELGAPSQPFGIAFESFSTGIGPTTHPLPIVGTACFDFFSPIYTANFYLLDATGRHQFTYGIPNDPSAISFAPLFKNCAVLINGNSALSISKTTRLQWEIRDQYRLIAPSSPATRRSGHTATALSGNLRDNRQDVFIAGGATGSIVTPVASATTAIFSPLTRTLRAGPFLNLPRSFHAAIRLNDGKVLITGGSTTNAAGTATCDLYDPVTDTVTLVASMNFPRMGHGISLLPDGRVFVTGGFADFQNAASNWAARLGTAQQTTEIYDPVADTWTLGPNMASRRAGHGHLTMPDGRVFLIAGINGGTTILAGGFTPVQIPTYTQTCEFLDPATLTFTAAPLITMPSNVFAPGQGRGFFGASLLPSGDVLVTGGAANIGSYGVSASTTDCVRFNGTAWVAAGTLPLGVSFHTQIQDPDTGNALIMGGLTAEFGFSPATANTAIHDGTTATALAPLGVHASFGQPATARALHTCTVLQDGTVFVFGGQTPDVATSTVTTYDNGYLYIR